MPATWKLYPRGRGAQNQDGRQSQLCLGEHGNLHGFSLHQERSFPSFQTLRRPVAGSGVGGNGGFEGPAAISAAMAAAVAVTFSSLPTNARSGRIHTVDPLYTLQLL